MATRAVPEGLVDLAPADGLIRKYEQDRDAVIALLQDVQEKYGYLPRQVLDRIAERLHLPRTQLYGLATFYRAFTLTPQGKHAICVCTGTACHVRGAPALLDRLSSDLKLRSGDTTDDGLFSLHTVNCVGACALGPVVTIDGEYQAHMNGLKLMRLLRKYGLRREGHGDASESK